MQKQYISFLPSPLVIKKIGYSTFLLVLTFVFACQSSDKTDQATNDNTEQPAVTLDTNTSTPNDQETNPIRVVEPPSRTEGAKSPPSLPQENNRASVTPNNEQPTIDPIGDEPEEAIEETNEEDLGLLQELRELCDLEKQEMLKEKNLASQANSQTLARSVFEKAQKNEQAGNTQLQLNTQKGFLNAQKLFRTAKQDYKDARASAESERTAGVRLEAERARTEMAASKRSISRNQTELNQNPKYQSAQTLESTGEQHFRQLNYTASKTAFQQAKDLYAQVASEPVKTSPATPVEKKDDTAMAQRKIKILLDKYANGLETTDLNGLRASGFITRQEETGWVQFFRNVKDLTVKIDNEQFNIVSTKAQVNFLVRMSYYNKSKRKREDSEFPKQWQLEASGGNWKIVSLN